MFFVATFFIEVLITVIILHLMERDASENKYISEDITLNICILPHSGKLITILVVWKTCFSMGKCSYKWKNCQKYWHIINNFKGKIQHILRIYAKNLKFPNHMAVDWLDSLHRIFTPSSRKVPQNIFWGKLTIEAYPEFGGMKCKMEQNFSSQTATMLTCSSKFRQP